MKKQSQQQDEQRQKEIRQKLSQKEKKTSAWSGRNIAITAFAVILLGAISLSVMKNEVKQNS